MGVQDIVRWLLPREDVFYGLIERQGVLLDEAATALARLAHGAAPAQVHEAVKEIEHRADALVHEIEEQLAAVFVTPIDREDIQLPALRRHQYARLIAAGRVIKQHEKDGDRIFRTAVSQLFHDPAIDAKELLREKEVLEDLELAIDRCETVSERLKHLAVKHG